MPALKNPRHEAFAQAILFGLLNSSRDTYSNGRAYQRAGYLTSNQNASDAAASRLLRKVKPILDRVRELQASLATQTKETKEKIIAELNQLNEKAQAKDAYGAAVSAVLGKAKVLNLMNDQPQETTRSTPPNPCMTSDENYCRVWDCASRTTFRSRLRSKQTMHSLSALRQYAMQLNGLP